MVKSTKKTPKAAIYVRVSTEEQAKEGFSLAAQEQALKDYAKSFGYDIYKIYRDEGRSAKDMKHRPELQQLLKDADRKYFQAILVYKLDRFSRSLKDLILTIEKLKSKNIDFISLQDKIETASASGKLMFHIISSFAEFERDIISERTRFGMNEKAKEGGIVGKPALGYRIQEGKLVIDNEQAEKVRIIFKEYLNTDKSLNTIANEHKLTVRGLLKILKNRTYVGEIKFKENYQGTHEHIIDTDTFEKVQDKLKQQSDSRQVKKYQNMLSQLFKDKALIEKILNLITQKQLSIEEKPIEIDINEAETAKMSGLDKQKNYLGHELLREEGFIDEEIFFNKMYVNADNPAVSAMHEQRKIYIEYNPEKYQKILDYTSEDIEVWIILTEKKYYLFKNTS
jgi:DNA invertase Pin-like site-specific DNA recombinase